MGAYISSKMGAGPPQQQQQQLPDGAPLQPQSAAAGGQQRPFPYVVPIVAKSGQLLFEETGRCSKVSMGWGVLRAPGVILCGLYVTLRVFALLALNIVQLGVWGSLSQGVKWMTDAMKAGDSPSSRFLQG
jgi:hypothetical protein